MSDLCHPKQSPDSIVEGFLTGVIPDLSRRGVLRTEAPATPVLLESVFTVLTGRQFGHLGRKRSEPFRSTVTEHLRHDFEAGRPLQFFFDIGPGYHASIRPGALGLSFEVGFAELMLLRQVLLFCEQVASLYAPGAHFHLVVDNLCGLGTNDIPLKSTQGYVDSLRSLVAAVGANDLVSPLVESEVTPWSDYSALLDLTRGSGRTFEATATDIDNVSRFLGRPCDVAEAEHRMGLYERTAIVTESLLAPSINGVRLTQRASPSTLGFRAFPGGDQRIQVGQLGITLSSKGKARPVLISSRNAPDLELTKIPVAHLASDPITHVFYVKRA